MKKFLLFLILPGFTLLQINANNTNSENNELAKSLASKPSTPTREEESTLEPRTPEIPERNFSQEREKNARSLYESRKRKQLEVESDQMPDKKQQKINYEELEEKKGKENIENKHISFLAFINSYLITTEALYP